LLPMNTMEVQRFLRFIDVFVYKTHDSFAETCPLAILEALAAGIPIVAEDKGGVSDLVIPMKTGYLCRKLPDYKAGVESLYHDPMMLARFSLQAREWAFENASVACYRKRLAQEFGL
jgi:glycosyltransferase involved in cell wall biosynthesis